MNIRLLVNVVVSCVPLLAHILLYHIPYSTTFLLMNTRDINHSSKATGYLM